MGILIITVTLLFMIYFCFWSLVVAGKKEYSLMKISCVSRSGTFSVEKDPKDSAARMIISAASQALIKKLAPGKISILKNNRYYLYIDAGEIPEIIQNSLT